MQFLRARLSVSQIQFVYRDLPGNQPVSDFGHDRAVRLIAVYQCDRVSLLRVGFGIFDILVPLFVPFYDGGDILCAGSVLYGAFLRKQHVYIFDAFGSRGVKVSETHIELSFHTLERERIESEDVVDARRNEVAFGTDSANGFERYFGSFDCSVHVRPRTSGRARSVPDYAYKPQFIVAQNIQIVVRQYVSAGNRILVPHDVDGHRRQSFRIIIRVYAAFVVCQIEFGLHIRNQCRERIRAPFLAVKDKFV